MSDAQELKTSPAGSRARRSQDGATSLEWTLLVAALVLVCYPTLNLALDALVSHYRILTTLNALPFP